MAVFRVNKTADYTVMSNFHLRDRRMSLKAKGLLSLILSLPNEWNYSLGGLVSICIERDVAVKTALNELKKYGYLRIDKVKPSKENGGRYEYIYNIFEQPYEKQGVEIQGVENLPLEIQPLENIPLYKDTNESNTDKSITNESSIDYSPRKRFTPPTLEEVQAYCKERNNNVDAKKFYDYYSTANWYDGKGEKVKSWKQKVITWEKNAKPIASEQQSSNPFLRALQGGGFDE